MLRITLVGAFDAHGALSGHHCFAKDVTDFKRMESRLRQAERLEGIGHLAAGVAHEINTPIQYVGDNIRFLDDGFRSLIGLVDAQRRALDGLDPGPTAEAVAAAVLDAEDQAELDYMRDEVPRAVSQALQGVDSVATIVRAMKQFSHPGATARSLVDLNGAIESTLTVARNEWKYVADVRTELDASLPRVMALEAEINQAILNVVLNAAQAIEEVVGRDSGLRGTITVTTRGEPGWVEIRVRDTGKGIPEAVRERVWDPFFTTKAVGKGTGQGLALVHSMVVDHHGGTVRFETEVGAGTEFILRLPVASRGEHTGSAT
jgi:signal transduction histidine kinase